MLRPLTVMFALFISTLVGFQNCTAAKFASESASQAAAEDNGNSTLSSGSAGSSIAVPVGPTSGILCTAATASQNLKVLFVVDNSTSTKTTDPGKKFRDGSLRTFVDKFSSNSNFSWGFIYFAADVSSYFGTPNAPAFSQSPEDITAAIDDFFAVKTANGTNYTNSLAAARNAIQNDPDRNDQSHPPFYLVIFMSDGEPSPKDPNVVAEVQSIVDVAPDRISVNTVYFGPNAPADVARLQSMANAGKGQFFNTNVVGTNIDFASTALAPSQACRH